VVAACTIPSRIVVVEKVSVINRFK
jgi:hypothetical protein